MNDVDSRVETICRLAEANPHQVDGRLLHAYRTILNIPNSAERSAVLEGLRAWLGEESETFKLIAAGFKTPESSDAVGE